MEKEMKDLEEKIAEVSSHLQDLTEPEIFQEVQNAVEARDKNALVRLCKKARIPQIYTGVIVSILLAVGPRQKWPLEF